MGLGYAISEDGTKAFIVAQYPKMENTPEAYAANVAQLSLWRTGPDSKAPFLPATTTEEFQGQQLAYVNRNRLKHKGTPLLEISADLTNTAQTTADAALANRAFTGEPAQGELRFRYDTPGDLTFGSNPFWD